MAVIAFADRSFWNTSVLHYAIWVANTINQPLTIVARAESIEADAPLAFDAYQHMDTREDMFRELAAMTRAETATVDTAAIEFVQSVARQAKDLGATRVRTVTTTDPFDIFIEQSTDTSDLLVVARQDDSESTTRQWTDQFLKVRRRTMLLVPATYAPIASWMIAIDGKPAAGRAVDFLTRNPLLQGTQGTAVYVGSDHQNRQHFRDAVNHLESAGLGMKTHELQGNPDDVLAAVLAVSPVDLVVMGAYGQGRFRSLIEGSTTSRMLKAFRGPVLLARA